MDDIEKNWKPTVEPTAFNILGGDPNDFEEPLVEYAKSIVQTRRRMIRLGKEVSEVSIKWTGWTALNRIRELENEFVDQYGEFESIHEAMAGADLREYQSTGYSGSEDLLLDQIKEGRIPEEIDRLETTATMITQQLNSKRISANTRLGIAVSVAALTIALASLLIGVF